VVFSMMRKVVRFYDLRMLPKDSNDSVLIDPGFWDGLGDVVYATPPEGCQVKVRGRLVHGEYRTCSQPACRYFYVGRVRPPADWPDTLDSTGAVGNLELSLRDQVLLGKTYVVPFGAVNRVAVLTMSQSAPRVSTLDDWFSRIAGLDPAVEQLNLVPILDRQVAERLEESSGATVLRVHAEPHADIPDGGGEIGVATRAAKAVSSETDIVLKWSLANRNGSAETTSGLLRAARWVRGDWAKSAVVSLQIPGDDEEGPRVEQYDLISHHFTRREKFDIIEGGRPTEESVISGITEAISGFNRAFS